ncbi:hypothetical protein BYT27DRAFT_7067828, partial [Phlegmacium glaucopus]
KICKNLEPRDLLSLSRVTKTLRYRLKSPQAKYIWLAVLEKDPSLPKHPQDMDIAQFASLVLDDWC